MIQDNAMLYLGTLSEGENDKLAKYQDITENILITNTYVAKIGLLRIGELMTGQFNQYRNNKTYWTITSNNDSNVCNIGSHGNGHGDSSTNSNGIKPAMILKQNVVITGGDGTMNSPFTLSIQ